jgi:nitrogen fixation/metabolism regulation signal transduction histidine kinase
MSPTRFSLTGKIAVLFAVTLVIMAGLAAGATLLPLAPWLIFLIILAAGLPLGLWMLNRFMRPVQRTIIGLGDGIRSIQDRDYSVRVASERDDELGELARLYNAVGEVLHHERATVRQREMVLQSAMDHSPVAIILVNQLDRVIFSNREARRLLLGEGKLEGRRFREVLEHCPEQMRHILAGDNDGLFSVESDEAMETYHLSRRNFTLNRQPHALYLLRRLTLELGRQEADIWKRVIRIISHELNNSLAPISSLAHSAQIIAQDPERIHRLDQILATIRQNTARLKQFLEGYARFARLPRPQKRTLGWDGFLENLRMLQPFELAGSAPSRDACFDPSHMQQVLTNLIKNAVEAAGDGADVTLQIDPTADGGTVIHVMDRGPGLDDEVMRNALLPFYSTKKEGAGLGLPLCREIIEAHGGRLSIQRREGGGTMVSCWLPPGEVG